MAESNDEGTAEDIPLTKKNDSSAANGTDEFDVKAFLKNPFGDLHDSDFWDQVLALYGDGKGIEWSLALNTVRLKHIKKRFELDEKDPLIALVSEVFDRYNELAERHAANTQIMGSFKLQLFDFAKLLLDEEGAEKYGELFETNIKEQKLMQTVLHMLAKRNLVDIAEIYVEKFPGSLYVTTDDDKLPLEMALRGKHDEIASFLAKNMYNERVRDLFESNETFNARFKFGDLIQDPGMRRTVIEVLECCINPDWPFTPVQEGEKEEVAWSKMPDTSLRYHFQYRLLDSDQSSEPPKVDGEENTDFKHREASCLQLIADSPHSQTALYHPVVRSLVDRKWNKFARRIIRLRCLFYIVFLFIMSCAFFTLQDTTSSSVKAFRHVCEVVTILFIIGYVVNEVDEMEKERGAYWTDFYNYCDLLGLILVLLLIPLRITDEVKAERGVGAVAYLINCIRLFKYFPAFKEVGIYSKTFAVIIYKDISMFSLIYGVCFMAFGGSLFLCMLSATGDGTTQLSLRDIFLKEFRALAEGNPFDDDYDNYNQGVAFLIMLNMLVIIVILSNILIGQLSYRYEVARQEANVQYSIDKTRFICKMENSRFRRWNNRIKFYSPGDYVMTKGRVQSLLEEWSAKKAEME